MRQLGFIALPLVAVACGGSSNVDTTPDASTPDGTDGGWIDSGSNDGSTTPDAGTIDASTPDASSTCEGDLSQPDSSRPACKPCRAMHCCAEYTSYYADPDYDDYVACMGECGNADGGLSGIEACINECGSSHPTISEKNTTAANCVVAKCEVECYQSPPSTGLVHVAYDHGPIDWCWRETGSSAWNGPVVGASGLTYKSSWNAGLPSGGTFDLHVIDAGGDCNAPIAAKDAANIVYNTHYTLAFVGSPPKLLFLRDPKLASDTGFVRVIDAYDGEATITVSTSYPPSGNTIGTVSPESVWTGPNIDADGVMKYSPVPSQGSLQYYFSAPSSTVAASYSVTFVKSGPLDIYIVPLGTSFSAVSL
ncbi:Hypothetical protein A7982_04436 [Minicystis rosea]|nr:Hypothetical protein A7982_04436 [Minicystis rosea]